MVEHYERPIWPFNKAVYIEKEGFKEALRTVRWPEAMTVPHVIEGLLHGRCARSGR